jgi:hypothetical protein
MKKLSFFLVLMTLALFTHAQHIRRVNNTPGLNDPNVYATAQAAQDAAMDGDTIYFEPTGGPNGVDYGEIIVTKKLTLIGPGYLLDKNPNTSFDKRPVGVSNIIFENGSTTSKVMGLNTSRIYIRDSLIVVTRCRLILDILFENSTIPRFGIYSKGTRASITDCVLRGVYGNQAAGQNHTISNNIFSIENPSGGAAISYLFLSVIKNNVFYHFPNNVVISECLNNTIFNNIFDARNSNAGNLMISNSSQGNSVSNNICLGISGLPSGSGNVNAANPTTIFKVQNPYGASPFWDDNFKLATNSPAKTVGVGGTEAGPFGGNNPYVLSGVPAVPVVTSFTNTGSGNTSTPLSVTISVRSAN